MEYELENKSMTPPCHRAVEEKSSVYSVPPAVSAEAERRRMVPFHGAIPCCHSVLPFRAAIPESPGVFKWKR
jgi:hypothetical protein